MVAHCHSRVYRCNHFILHLAPIVQDTGFQWLHTGLCVPLYVVLSVI